MTASDPKRHPKPTHNLQRCHTATSTDRQKKLLSAPTLGIRGMLAEMGRKLAVVLYVVAMAAVIIGVDFAFFRNRFWERLTANIGIVLVFAAFYLRFLKDRI
jgi:hypothetical protein